MPLLPLWSIVACSRVNITFTHTRMYIDVCVRVCVCVYVRLLVYDIQEYAT